jgi:hypothetical protein
MRRTGRQQRSLKFLQAIAIAVVAIVGCLLVAAKVSAQPKQAKLPTPGSAQAPAVPSALPSTARSAGIKLKVAPSASGSSIAAAPSVFAKAAPVASAPSADAGAPESPLDYAEVQTDSDFPEGASEEEKSAIGNGKVPIHREGKFKSPFAHPHFGGPTTAKVGLVIQQVREYNIQTGSFEAEFFLSLTGDKDFPKLDPTFTNGHEVDIKALADTPTFKLYHVSGKFLSPVDLRQYPFDTQKISIELEDQSAGVDQIVFSPDDARTSLDEGFDVASFGVASIGAHAYKHGYPPRFDRDDLYVSRYKFILGLDRFATSAAFSVYVPAYIIVLISLIGLWVPADELEVRSAAGAPMLAAAVLFHYSLISALPATGYLTHADKLMLGVYISLLMNMLTTWAFLIVEEENLERWFRWFRAWVPPLTIVVMAVSSII